MSWKTIANKFQDLLHLKSESKPVAKYIYVLDAGHGGIDSNGVYQTAGKRSPEFSDGSILYEGEVNRYIAARVKEEMLKYYKEVNVVLPHDAVKDTPLTDRVNTTRRLNSEKTIFISIHSNAFGASFNSAHGWEIFYSTTSNSKSLNVAKIFEDEFKKEFPNERNRGIKTSNFQVIKNTRYPSVLLENFFMTNERECRKYLIEKKGREQLVKYIFEAIKRIDNEI
jgi:N-acetylmuramoyl-L-alanine amidase